MRRSYRLAIGSVALGLTVAAIAIFDLELLSPAERSGLDAEPAIAPPVETTVSPPVLADEMETTGPLVLPEVPPARSIASAGPDDHPLGAAFNASAITTSSIARTAADRGRDGSVVRRVIARQSIRQTAQRARDRRWTETFFDR